MVTEIGRASGAFLPQLRHHGELLRCPACPGDGDREAFDTRLRIAPEVQRANHPYLERTNTEVKPAVILHLLADLHFRRDETFASLTSLEAFLARTDLRLVSARAQEVIRAIFPSLSAEESLAATPA